MAQTTIMRSVRTVVDSKRILDVLLRNLTTRRTITPEDMDTILGITIRKIADGVPYAVPATIDDPAILGEITEILTRLGYPKEKTVAE